MLGAKFVTVVPCFSAYELDADGMIGPAPAAASEAYDPFEGFTLGRMDRPGESRPPYESFLNVSTAEEALAWVRAHGLLGIGPLPSLGPVVFDHYTAVAGTFDPAYGESGAAIISAAQRMRVAAEGLRSVELLRGHDDLSSVGPAWTDLAHVLDGTTYGRGVFLAPMLSFRSLPPRWQARFTYGALIEALHAMLLFDLDGGQELRECGRGHGCGRLFTARRTSPRVYCSEVCSMRYKQRRYREGVRAKQRQARQQDQKKGRR